jgi:hypothetical protein
MVTCHHQWVNDPSDFADLIEGDKDVGDGDAGDEGGFANDEDGEEEDALADFGELVVVDCGGVRVVDPWVDNGHEDLSSSERKARAKPMSSVAAVHTY